MINWARVIELRNEIGADDFTEVIDLFLEEVEATLDSLATESGDDNIEETMHFLKGSALNLGFASLATLCQRSESAAARGDTSFFDRDAVLQTYAASKAEFMVELDKRLAA